LSRQGYDSKSGRPPPSEVAGEEERQYSGPARFESERAAGPSIAAVRLRLQNACAETNAADWCRENHSQHDVPSGVQSGREREIPFSTNDSGEEEPGEEY